VGGCWLMLTSFLLLSAAALLLAIVVIRLMIALLETAFFATMLALGMLGAVAVWCINLYFWGF
jgi:hypothetical protein